MQDLEFTLGSTTAAPYLSARLTYRHSAFPNQPDCFPSNGTSRVQTRLETTATASIRRHSTSSPWSPRSGRQETRDPNPLYEIIASHWGPRAAADVTRRVLLAPPGRGTPGPKAKVGMSRTMGARMRAIPPVVPKRKGSLRMAFVQTTAGGDARVDHEDDECERQNDRAREIWTDIRRMSSVGSVGEGEEDRRVSAGSASHVVSDRERNDVERRRAAIREKALRNQRSVGADTLRSLVPTLAEENVCGQGEVDRDGAPKSAVMHRIDSLNGRGRKEKEKENLRWNWTGWWQ
jgi:hypothetical protein